MTLSASTTGSTSGDDQQVSTLDTRSAHAETFSWLASQVAWELRLRELRELKVISQATDGRAMPGVVAAPAAMGQHRDDLDALGGVANGLEVVGSLA